jgi:hypothetical protein
MVFVAGKKRKRVGLGEQIRALDTKRRTIRPFRSIFTKMVVNFEKISFLYVNGIFKLIFWKIG